MLEVGIKAPDFELPDQNGKIHRLSDYTGKKVILYFYPKDNTLSLHPVPHLRYRADNHLSCEAVARHRDDSP